MRGVNADSSEVSQALLDDQRDNTNQDVLAGGLHVFFCALAGGPRDCGFRYCGRKSAREGEMAIDSILFPQVGCDGGRVGLAGPRAPFVFLLTQNLNGLAQEKQVGFIVPNRRAATTRSIGKSPTAVLA